MAADLRHPERVVGIHFFNPVAQMPLVEVINARATSDEALATAFAITKKLRKTAIMSADRPGFIVNRLLLLVMGQVVDAIEGGTPVEVADRALAPLGFPMPTFELTDLVGPAVAQHVLTSLRENLGDRIPALARPGQDRRGRHPRGAGRPKGLPKPVDPAIQEYFGEALTPGEPGRHGQSVLDADGVLDQVLTALTTEIGLMLDEGVVPGPQQIDLAMILGAGWGFHTGGITPYLDRTGYSEKVLGKRFLPDGVANVPCVTPGAASGPSDDERALVRRCRRAPLRSANMTDVGPGTHAHYVVVGDGPLAFRLARALSTRFRGTVSVVVPDRSSRYAQEMAALDRVELVETDRVDEKVLTTAGAGRATAAALVDQDDGGNVALALLLREAWPALHVVVRIFDESLGRHLQRDRCTVLSASAFAAPEIVAAALRRLVRLPVQHRRLVAVTDSETSLPTRMVLFATDEDGTVTALPNAEELAGLAPKVLLADAAERDVLPEMKADLEPDEDEVDPHRRRRFAEYLRTLAITSGWNLLLAAGVLLVVVLLGAMTIQLATGSSFFGALYEAVLPSLAGSDPDHDANPVVKATQVVLTIVSVAVIPWVTGVVVDGVVRTQRLLDAGSPLHAMSDHVVVVGLGDLGTRIVRSLDRRGVPVVAVDIDESARGIAVARARDVPVVIGDARRAATLRAAYVDTAQAIVVVTSGGATTDRHRLRGALRPAAGGRADASAHGPARVRQGPVAAHPPRDPRLRGAQLLVPGRAVVRRVDDRAGGQGDHPVPGPGAGPRRDRDHGGQPALPHAS